MAAYFAVGRYTHPPYTASPQADGIHVIKLDLASGVLSSVTVNKDVQNVSWFASAPGDDHLYAVSSGPISVLSRFKINVTSEAPTLELEAKTEFADDGGVYVGLDGKVVTVACFNSGVVRLFDAEGDLESKQRWKFTYCTDPASDKQNVPHSHCAVTWPGRKGVYAVADLGADRVYTVTSGSPNPEIALQVESGVGPRLILFHPTKKLAFLVTELSNELLLLDVDETSLKIRQCLPIIGYPDSVNNDPEASVQKAAHLAISDDGSRIWVSNRGRINDIVEFKLKSDESIEFVRVIPTKGKIPRAFAIVDEKYLIAANQKSNSIVSYRIDGEKPEEISELAVEAVIALWRLV
uniref:Lactonase, 7-bladed beta-propeller-domain-containing protein n=1 Tax=Panagrellus redivivus TaxID=6233 RepID=A0A7E4VP64_PANRE